LLRVRNLSYKGILRGVSAEFGRGEVVAVVGKNGAGKTTFMKCISGFLKYGGNVLFNGREMRTIPLRERVKMVNYLPQQFSVPFPFTVIDFLRLSLIPEGGIFSPLGRDDERRIFEVLERFGIKELSGADINSISGGERAKVLLSRILLIDPEIYMLDEPGAFLDIGILGELSSLIRDASRRGRTVMIAAHDVNLLMEIAERFIGLKDGRLFMDGGREDFISSVRELFDAELEVRRFGKEVFIKPLL